MWASCVGTHCTRLLLFAPFVLSAPVGAQERRPAGATHTSSGREGPASKPIDRWFARDKVRHAGSSAAIQLMGYGGLRTAGSGRGASLTVATIVSAAAGVGKELRDARRGGDPSLRDLVADGVGIVAGTLLIRLGDPR